MFPLNRYVDDPAFVLSFEACAISLFYGKITLSDVVICLDNWKNFRVLFNTYKKSVYKHTLSEREAARNELSSQELSQFHFLIPLIRKIYPNLFYLSNLLYLLEQFPGENFESEFEKLFTSKEIARRKLEKSLVFLHKIILDERIRVSRRTLRKIERAQNPPDYLELETLSLHEMRNRELQTARVNLRRECEQNAPVAKKAKMGESEIQETCRPRRLRSFSL